MPGRDQTLRQFTDQRSSTSVAAMGPREVLSCPHCSLVQFRTRNSLCRRCHKPLVEPDKRPLKPDLAVSMPETPHSTGTEVGRHLAMRVREFRKMRGLSQKALSCRMNVPRTYISKVEWNRTVPTIATLYRIANALDVGVEQLLSHTGIRQLEVAAMSQDPFLQEIALLSRELSAEQRAIVLEAVRDAAIHANSGVEP